MSRFIPQGLGWVPDLPDPRDYTFRHEAVLPLLERLRRSRRKSLPNEVDLRRDAEGEYFTPCIDQGPLNSSTAIAVLSLVEYFERRMRGQPFDGSKQFLYRVTRNVRQKRISCEPCPGSHPIADTGADLRTTLKVLASVGVPAEEYWPYEISKFDEEPSAFTYSLAKPPCRFHYFRLDEPNHTGSQTWFAVASFLAAGFPIVFGFAVPSSLTADANVPYRADLDGIRGGQAVVAVGYRHHYFGRGKHALLIRNSWGSRWGDNGVGWLPVVFLRQQLARNFWTFVSEDWLVPSELSRPRILDLDGAAGE